MPVDVSVIIVSYNARELLDACLDSVARTVGSATTVEVIVADNASVDGSVRHLRENHPQVQVVELPENRGFAAGNNAALELATGRYLLLLNSDARLCGGALEELVTFMDANPGVGMAGPKLLNPDGSLQRSARAFPTVWRLATEYLFLRKLAPRSRVLNDFYKGWFSYDRVADMDFLMGACLIVRREALEEVGPMSEDYFMFSEETDWARRFWDAGWRVVFVPSAEVVHLGGGSTRKEWMRMYSSQVVGHLRYLARHESVGTARRARALLRASLLLRGIGYGVASRIRPGSPEYCQRLDAYRAARRELAEVDVRQLQLDP